MRLLVASVLLVALLPLPTAQAASWSVDATVSVLTATTADYTWRIDGLQHTNLTLPIPDNATFVEAREEGGERLNAGTQGSNVWVVSRTKAFTIRFRLEGMRDGPFSIFPAQVASAADSPVTVGITTPPGWTVSGYRNNDENAPRDMAGRFHHTGPAYVQWLVLQAGVTDPGPDPTVSGHTVRREGTASIARDRVEWTLVTTYDTDVFGRSWEVHLPAGASAVSATTPLGTATTRLEGDILHVTTPYPVGYALGARPFTVRMTLPAPEPHGGPFLQSNLSIRAGEGDRVSITATLAEGLRYAGARIAGGSEATPLRYTGSGPLSVGIAFLPPASPGHVQFDEGLFVVDAPEALASAARATARNATLLLPSVASFAYEGDTRPFFVGYTAEPIFGWEEGFYSNGLNTISIRASTLANATDGQPHLVPVGVLVHEATHGLLDRRMPDAPHDLSFLHEGLARLAETNVETVFADEVLSCRREVLTESCDRHSARPSAGEVQAFHQQGNVFDVAWGADRVPDASRGFLYDYSGLVMHAFAQRAPAGALDNALLTISRTVFTEDPARDADLLLGILLENAPGTPAEALLYPGREAVALSPGQFHFCLGELVAPPYPWEERDVKSPPGGCPATGWGPRDAELPPPPPEPVVEPEPEPVVVKPTSVVYVTPVSTPPSGSTPPPGDATTDPGELPGAIVSPEAPGSATPSAIPGAPALLAAFAAALVALALTPRRR